MGKKATLYYNGKIYSLKEEGEVFDAMLVKGGKIEKLYNEVPKSLSGVKSVDLGGKTVLPSFSDTHMHYVFSAFVMGAGLCISEITADGIVPKDLQGVRQKIADYIQKENTDTVLCFNYMVAGIKEERLPTRQELESWFPNVNISIITMDAHSSSHTSDVLKYMDMYSENCDGVLAGEDHEFNTGKLFEYYQKKKLNLFAMIGALKKFSNILLSYGVTDIICLEGTDDQESNASFAMIRFSKYLSKITHRVSPQLTDKARVKKLIKGDEHPKVGGCGTWELDGAIGSKTAAFDIPYLGGSDCGKAYYSLDEAQTMIEKFHSEGCQTLIHAIGTEAIDIAIKAYKNVLGDASQNENRCRIEHFEFPTDEHMEVAADMNLLVSVQPGYSWMDYNYQHSYEKWIDAKLFDRQVPLKKLYDMGVCMLGSSDSPVQMPDPFIQLQGMVNYPIESQRLSVFEALRTYTYNNAYANFAENEKGTLEVGKLADFVVLDRNPFEIEKNGLVDVKVDETYIKGKRVYKR